MRRRLGSLICAIAAFTVAVAHAAPAGTKKVAAKAIASKSIGAPNKGKLEGGVHLGTGKHLRVLGAYAAGDARWGVRELVDAVDRAAREVRKRFPDAVLGVGDFSHKGGGSIDRHHSHESGRDADLAFYLVDVAGKPVQKESFLTIRADGIAASDTHLRFDEGRNWALVSALVTDPKARVTHIFVATHLRTRLLAYAARVAAPAALRAKVAEVLMQPHHALPHDDHFHVRVACPATSSSCVEWPISTASKKTSGAALAKAKAPKTPKPPTKKLVRTRSKIGAPPLEKALEKAVVEKAPVESALEKTKASDAAASKNDEAVVAPLPAASAAQKTGSGA